MFNQQLQSVKHDRTAMTIPTSSPCEDGFLAPIVRYFNLSYFIKTETKLLMRMQNVIFSPLMFSLLYLFGA